jgi:hypothetical protein
MASKTQPFKRDFRGAPVETKTFQGDGEDSFGSNPAKNELDQIANRNELWRKPETSQSRLR